MRYIQQNPNVNRQNIVDNFKGTIARSTVFNIINNLVKYGIIKDKLDEKNRQTHRLDINNDDIFFSVIQELGVFEKKFSRLCSNAWKKAESYGSGSDEF